jgi:hypothetical protein
VRAESNVACTEGHPPQLTVCPRGAWNERMLGATTFALLPLLCPAAPAIPRAGRSFTLRRACSGALVTLLVQCDGLPRAEQGCAPRSSAHFSL